MEKYEKIRVVGRGVYGTVHLRFHLSDRKHVIIKQIPVEQMTKDEPQAVLNEVKVLSMLHHPYIIQYFENFLEDKALMIVKEYAEGEGLETQKKIQTILQCNKLALDDYSYGLTKETTSFTPVPSVPVSNLQIKMVALGTSHSAVITTDGDCYTFGSNQFGQLGIETEPGNRKPKLVNSLQEKIVLVSCGDIFTVVVSEDNKVFTRGKSSRGRLGRSIEDSHLPKPVVFPNDEEVFEVLSLSSCHSSTVIATRPKPNYPSPV